MCYLVGAAVDIGGMSRNSPLSELLYDQHVSKRRNTTGTAPYQLVSYLVETHNKLISDDDRK